MRAIRFEIELLPTCDHIQVCTEENKRYLESFLPGLSPRDLHEHLRLRSTDLAARLVVITGEEPSPHDPFVRMLLTTDRYLIKTCPTVADVNYELPSRGNTIGRCNCRSAGEAHCGHRVLSARVGATRAVRTGVAPWPRSHFV